MMMSQTVSAPSALSPEVRQAAWSRLWQVLLREPSNDESESREIEPGSEVVETNEATARAAPEKEVRISEQ